MGGSACKLIDSGTVLVSFNFIGKRMKKDVKGAISAKSANDSQFLRTCSR